MKNSTRNWTNYATHVENTTCTTHQSDNNTFHTQIQNLMQVEFNNEDTKLLKLGFSYAFEKPAELFISELKIDTENEKIQNTCRYLAKKNIDFGFKHKQHITQKATTHYETGM